MSTSNEPPQDEFGYIEPDMAWLRPLFDKLILELDHYTVSLTLKDRLIGSGTLVIVGGRFGILTAHHVAEILCKDQTARINVIIAGHEHLFSIKADFIEHHVVGRPHGDDEAIGPDLSFLQLLDSGNVGTLKSKKSFYHLEGKSFGKFEAFPFKETPWFVAGAPAELVSGLNVGTPAATLEVKHFFGEAVFDSMTEREGFDFLRLEIFAGRDDYPKHFGGVSGGGLWLIQLSKEIDIPNAPVSYEAPFLAGVAFHQSELREDKRIISGHGPASIYHVLPKLLSIAEG